VHYEAGSFYALKGNKTRELWKYTPGMTFAARPMRSGTMADSEFGIRNSAFVIAPNPLITGYATLRYSLPRPGPVQLNVFDIAGRSVATRTLTANRTGAVNLDLRTLSAGVYLVRLEATGYSATSKLVVEH